MVAGAEQHGADREQGHRRRRVAEHAHDWATGASGSRPSAAEVAPRTIAHGSGFINAPRSAISAA
jgi:hypothetical protein